jgi:dienelactone hydrolase
MQIWSLEIKEIETLLDAIKGRSPELEKELEQLVRTEDANVVLLYSRRCLEVIITDLCECELKRPRKTEPLKGIIDRLNKEEKVPANIITSMDHLNSMSAFGTHPKDFDPEQVRPALINLETVLKWYLRYKNIEIHPVAETKKEGKAFAPAADEHPFPERGKEPQRSDEITKKKHTEKSLYKKPQVWITSLVVFITLFIFIIQVIYHNKEKWANTKALSEIEQLYNEENQIAAFDLFQKAGKFLSKDEKFKDLSKKILNEVTILTKPEGAKVYIREYNDSVGKWKKIGSTPIQSIELPNSAFYLMKIEKEGYEEVLTVLATELDTVFRTLFSKGTIPPGMVYVEGYKEEVKSNFFKEKNGFFLDRYEVTNKQFKEFIDNGGYSNSEYWKYEFIKDGKPLTREEAMKAFTDATGRTGPATWEAGDYPDGTDDYPVSGISWYEAAAYAEYAGKSLPTCYHWWSGAGFFYDPIWYLFGSRVIPKSNFDGKGAEPAGKYKGINYFGAYDMAGNVREWCWNETSSGRAIVGGAWDSPSYMYSFPSQLPPFDRSPENGFRCVQYIDRDKIPEDAFQLIDFSTNRDYTTEKPVTDEVFRVYKNQFLYDKTALDAVIEETDSSYSDWITERITFNAAYSNERMVAYLFLPENYRPPYQTIVYFPWVDALWEKFLNKPEIIDVILKSGRAFMYPIYRGTHERYYGLTGGKHYPQKTHQYTQWLIYWVKDLSRSIDYLETRTDIDTSKIGFMGISWGAMFTPIMPAVEDRLKVCISVLGGFPRGEGALPEADAINYVSRVNIPVLMLNGRYDSNFPFETTVEPMYNLLGTPEKDKRLCVYETDHHVPRNEGIKETLNFLDKYFGPPVR